MPYAAKPVPQAKTVTPFSTKASPFGIGHFIAYRPREEMSQNDRDLAAKTLPAIRDAAAFAGIEFDKEKWHYRQLECQALPGHLFLLFAEIAASAMPVFFPPRFNAPARAVSASFPWSGADFLFSRRLPSTCSP